MNNRYSILVAMNRFKILFLLLVTLPVSAQELYFKPFPAFQNLPSFETYYTFQDSKGSIWVCTDAGVSRYDGNTVAHFTTKDGLCENVVFRVYEDKKGRIWFSTLSGLFCYYYNNKFYSIKANLVLKNYYKGTPVQSFFIGEKDTLYFSLMDFYHEGVAKIPPQNNYEKLIISSTKEIHQSLTFILTNPINPNEAISGVGGAVLPASPLCWDKKVYPTPYSKNNTSFANVLRFSISRKNNTLYTPNGMELCVLKKNDNTIKHYFFSKEIIYIHCDKEGDLWILLKRGGGYFYKNADLNSKPVHFLNDLSVSSVMIDREGSIWASTLDKGVFVCNSKTVLTIPNQNNDKIGNIQVDTNRLLISFFSKQLISFYKGDSIVKDTAACVYSSANYLHHYYEGKGYFYYDKLRSFYYASQHKNSKPILLINGTGAKEFVNYKGDTVIGITLTMLFVFYHEKKLLGIQSNSTMNCITKLHDGTILIGNRDDKGIFEFKNNQLLPYLSQFKQLRIRINAIVEDKNNRLWIASENGLMCIDEKQTLYQYNKQKDGLNLKINALTVDEENNIWCSNGNSLIRLQNPIDLTNPVLTTFNTCHGLPDTRIERLAAFDNRIWCTTKDYVFYFKNNSLKKKHIPAIDTGKVHFYQ